MRVNGIKKQFWLNRSDAEQLKKKAKKACLNEVSLIRFLIRGYEPKEKPDEEFYSKMSEIGKFTDSISKVAYMIQDKDETAYTKLLEEIKRWHKFQANIEKRFLLPEEKIKEWQ